jgi:hypothetical protein
VGILISKYHVWISSFAIAVFIVKIYFNMIQSRARVCGLWGGCACVTTAVAIDLPLQEGDSPVPHLGGGLG